MATEKVGLKISADTNEASGSIGSLKKQLREAQNEVAALADKFGDTSQEAINAAKRAAELKDRIGDAKALTESFNPDQKFTALSKSIGAAAGAFSALQGAMGLIGAEGKDVEKALLKVQSAMAISQGLEQLGDFKDSFKNLKSVAVNAFNGIKAAIGSTGIGLLVIALGVVVAYWDDIKAAVSGVSSEQKKLAEQTRKAADAEKEKLKDISAQDNVLKLQGKSEKEILQLKIKQIDAAIKADGIAIEANERNLKSQIEAEKRNKRVLQSILDVLIKPTQFLIDIASKASQVLGFGKINFDIAEKVSGLIFDPKKTEENGLKELAEQKKAHAALINDRAGFVLSLNAINNPKGSASASSTKSEKSEKKEKEYVKPEWETTDVGALIEKETISTSVLEGGLKKRMDLRLEDFEKQQAQAAEFGRQLIDAEQELQMKKFDAASAGVDLIASLAGKNESLANIFFVVQKAIEIGKIITSTTSAIAAVNASTAMIPAILPPGVPNPAYPVALALGVKKIASLKIGAAIGVASIAASSIAKFKNGGGGGAAAGGDSAGGAAPIAPPAPVQQTNTTIAQDSINKIGATGIKAYVVESDVSGVQQRIQRLEAASRIG